MNLSAAEKHLLTHIKNAKRFPVVRFELRCSSESALISTALNNVWLRAIDETMEQIKANAALLEKLEQDGIINICYSLPVTARSDYQIYYDCLLFAELSKMVAEGKGKPGFLFDTAFIKRGVATFTEYGRQVFLVN